MQRSATEVQFKAAITIRPQSARRAAVSVLPVQSAQNKRRINQPSIVSAF